MKSKPIYYKDIKNRCGRALFVAVAITLSLLAVLLASAVVISVLGFTAILSFIVIGLSAAFIIAVLLFAVIYKLLHRENKQFK